MFLIPVPGRTEGTKEIMPASNSYGRLEVYPNFSPFTTYNCPEEYRLNIRICNAGEKIYFGFGQTYDANQIAYSDVSFRVRAPDGTIVMGPTSVPSSGTGFISSYTRAVTGPSTIAAGGYTPFSYLPLTTGDYYIEFDFEDFDLYRREFMFFDITVATAAGEAASGRLWSKAWQLTTSISAAPDYYDNPFDGTMYVYADDGIVTSVDFNGMRPLVFTVCANRSGCFNTGNQYQDRKSVIGYYNYPQYKVFLNPPDEDCFPTGELGSITQPSWFSGCTPGDYCINITVNQAGTVEILLELNGISGFQPNTADRMIIADVEEGHNCIPFDGLNGLGNPVQENTQVVVSITYYNGITHLPLTDVEYNENGYIVRIIRPYTPNPVPALFWDDTNIPFGSTSPDGGCTNPTGCHNFYNFFGDSCTINTWWYASENVHDTLDFVFHQVLVDASLYTPYGADNDTA
ncbi:MAG: hypothetical protein KJ607_11955, partial [Bacteroidetes bacterium]|nr:hypothetical protein [Bacteroidota bacterium]